MGGVLRQSLLVMLGVALIVAVSGCAKGVSGARTRDSSVSDGDGSTAGQDGGTPGQDGGTPGQDGGTPGQDGSTPGPDSTPGQDSGTVDGGAPCQALPQPPTAGAQCAGAIDLGTLNDNAGDLITVSGNGYPAGRAVWFTFLATDDIDTSGDEFHVDVHFTTNPGNAYEMDVYRGGCSSSDQIASAERSIFDWYTNFATTSAGCTQSAPCGEGDCVAPPGAEGVNACEDNTATFYVRVRRADGTASCDDYTLELSNGVYNP